MKLEEIETSFELLSAAECDVVFQKYERELRQRIAEAFSPPSQIHDAVYPLLEEAFRTYMITDFVVRFSRDARGETTMSQQPPFALQHPGKITSIDALRLAAKALDYAANDLAAREKDPNANGRTMLEIETSLRSIPPLIDGILSAGLLQKSVDTHPALAATQALDNDGKPIE